MYKITKDGKVLAITDRLWRCKMQTNGVPVVAKEDDTNAPGVIVNGTIYNLPGYETAVIEEFSDVRALINEIQAGSATTEDICMALAELGQLVAGGVDNG